MQTFAEQLNAMRKERHITQEQLAQELNVSRTTISRWESGKVLPDIETIKQLSQVLNYNFFTVEGFAEERQPAEAEDSVQPEKSRKKLVFGLAALVLAAIFIVSCIFLNRTPKDTTKETAICPLAIFAVNESVTPAVNKALGHSEPAFIYQFSVQNITTDTSFTINKALIELHYPDGAAPFCGEYSAPQIISAFGTTEFTPGFGSLWMGAEMAEREFSGVTLTLEGIDSLGNEHSVSGYVNFDYPEKIETNNGLAQNTQRPTQAPAPTEPLSQTASADIVITPSDEVAYLDIIAVEEGDPVYGWHVDFLFENRSAIPFTIEKIVGYYYENDTLCAVVPIRYKDLRPHMKNDKLLNTDGALEWSFSSDQQYMTHMICTIYGTDDNGNKIEVSATVQYSLVSADVAEGP